MGRTDELHVLTAWLDEATSGRGGVVLLSGESGIGKTRLMEELAARAEKRGVESLWGRCWEGDGAPAFWPWREVLRTHLQRLPADEVEAEAGTGTADLALIVPDVRMRLHDILPVQAADGGQDRFRLFDSVATLLRAASRRGPLLILLDDLHWADEPSLVLLQYVVRELRDSPLLFVGTYRPEEIGDEHPLHQALVALRRWDRCDRIPLRGLEREQILSLVQALTTPGSAADAPELARDLHDRTDGNPFFVQELVRHIAESGSPGSPGDAIPPPGRIVGVPEGVRDVILRRLARLPGAFREVLTIAAVLGRTFDLRTLRSVAAGSEVMRDSDGGFAALDAAEAARVIVAVDSAPGTYAFSHALVRETLYGELTSLRRMRLHRLVGEGLERLYAQDLDAHAAELAYHFAGAAPDGDIDKAIGFSLRAGERAMHQLAYEEAARHFAQALQALQLAGREDPTKRCDVLLSLGEAQSRAGDTPSSHATFRHAASLARQAQVPELLARAALGFGGLVVTVGVVERELIALLETALALLDAGDSPLRARLLGRLAMELLYADEPERRDELSRQAVAMARRLADDKALGYTLFSRHYAIWEPATLDERLALAREQAQLGMDAGDLNLALQGRRWLIPDMFEAGDRAGVEAELALLAEQAGKLRQPIYLWYTDVFRASLALLDGCLAEAEGLIERAYTIGLKGQQGTARVYQKAQLIVLLREQGRLSELVPWLTETAGPTMPALHCCLTLAAVESGREEEARARVDALATDRFRAIRRDLTWLASIAVLAEVCSRTSQAAYAAELYEQLVPYRGRNAMMGIPTCWGSVERSLGQLATTMQRWAAAEEHFRNALAANERLGACLWLTRTRYDYARMLLLRRSSGDAARASALLGEALSTARSIQMTRLVGEVAALRADAERPDAPARSTDSACHTTSPAGLTPREMEVLRLIAAGRTTKEMAESLTVSLSTIERHITNIYAKIEARGRADATAFAFSHGILSQS